jgi:hypothetical protein
MTKLTVGYFVIGVLLLLFTGGILGAAPPSVWRDIIVALFAISDLLYWISPWINPIRSLIESIEAVPSILAK